MADHPDRFTCGKTGTMFYKLDASGKRIPPPKQNKPQPKEKEEKGGAAKKAPAKGKIFEIHKLKRYYKILKLGIEYHE